MLTQESAPPELFLAFIAATGTDLDALQSALSDFLESVRYDLKEVRLSDRLKQWKQIHVADKYQRIVELMDAGDELREKAGDKASVVYAGLDQVIQFRKENTSSDRGLAFLFRSLKTPEEVYALRDLYGQAFYAIAVFSEKNNRIRNLVERFAMKTSKETDAAFLSTRDETDHSNHYGQNVRDTFPLADLFVNGDKPSTAKKELERFVQLIFGNTFQTPTKDEYAMFFAQGAAYRSADLGRQVGASIASKEGDILALGTNEVPVVGGGQYWAETLPDNRDHVQDEDWNSRKQHDLVKDLLERINEDEGTKVQIPENDLEMILERLFGDNRQLPLKGAEVLSVIGFYRSVHGETAAIIDAARRGISVRDARLFVTAFPCHECARHVLAAGIKRVVYIEPYPKSLAQDQYPESIAVTSSGDPEEKLPFLPFVGVAPRQYNFLFAKNKRKKKDGTVIHWKPSMAKLRYGRRVAFYEVVEKEWSESIINFIKGE